MYFQSTRESWHFFPLVPSQRDYQVERVSLSFFLLFGIPKKEGFPLHTHHDQDLEKKKVPTKKFTIETQVEWVEWSVWRACSVYKRSPFFIFSFCLFLKSTSALLISSSSWLFSRVQLMRTLVWLLVFSSWLSVCLSTNKSRRMPQPLFSWCSWFVTLPVDKLGTQRYACTHFMCSNICEWTQIIYLLLSIYSIHHCCSCIAFYFTVASQSQWTIINQPALLLFLTQKTWKGLCSSAPCIFFVFIETFFCCNIF